MALQNISNHAFQAGLGPSAVPGCACEDFPASPEQEALQRFDDAYLLWKAVTVRYEHEMLLMNTGDAEAYARIVVLVQDMAHAHHEFLHASQPLFRAHRERMRTVRPSSFSSPPATQRAYQAHGGQVLRSTHL